MLKKIFALTAAIVSLLSSFTIYANENLQTELFQLPITDENAIIERCISTNKNGIEFFAAKGTPVCASASGTVSKIVEDKCGYGTYIILDHENNYQTLYAHNEKILVSEGDQVEHGDIIAEVGRTGNATDYSLQFEIRLNNVAIDMANIQF